MLVQNFVNEPLGLPDTYPSHSTVTETRSNSFVRPPRDVKSQADASKRGGEAPVPLLGAEVADGLPELDVLDGVYEGDKTMSRNSPKFGVPFPVAGSQPLVAFHPLVPQPRKSYETQRDRL